MSVLAESRVDEVDATRYAVRSSARNRWQRIRLIPCADRGVWNALARMHPGGTAFHEWDFLDLQERMLGIRVERLLLMADDEPAGIVPVAKRSARSMRAPWMPFPFLGPAVDPALLTAALRAYRHRQRRTGFVLGRFDLAPGLAAHAAGLPERIGMRTHANGSVAVDLRHPDVESLDAAMARTRRQQVRQALRCGVHARTAQPGETSSMLGRVLEEAYTQRGGRNPYPEDIGSLIEEWAAGRDDVRLGSVLVEDEHVGSLVLLTGHTTAVVWVGGALAAARDRNVQTILLRDAMIHAMQRGNETLEFAGRVDDQVERFKLSFGGRVTPYTMVESFLGPYALRDVLGRLR